MTLVERTGTARTAIGLAANGNADPSAGRSGTGIPSSYSEDTRNIPLTADLLRLQSIGMLGVYFTRFRSNRQQSKSLGEMPAHRRASSVSSCFEALGALSA